VLLRQRDLTRSATAVRIVGVKIGAAAHAEAEGFGDAEIVRRRQVVVIAVVDLERVETVLRISRQPVVVFQQSRVRERRDPASGMDALKDLFGRSTFAGHKRRPAP